MRVTQLADGVVRIETGDRQFTGLATYTPAGGLTLQKLTGLQREHGWIVGDGPVADWHIEGFTQHDGRVYLYGAPVAMRALSEIQQLDWDHLLPYVIRLATAFQSLQREGVSIGPVHTRSILFLQDGGVLFLPRTLARGIADQQSDADRMEFQHLYNHPDRSDEENQLFALAVICYRALTGVFPYTAETEDELRNIVRARPPLPAQLRAPDLCDNVSQALQRALVAPLGASSSNVGPRDEPRIATDIALGRASGQPTDHDQLRPMQLWVERLRDWRRGGVQRPLTDEQRIAVQARAVVTERKINRSYRRREFLRRNWQKMVVILLVVVLAGTVPGTIIRNRLQPHATAGMSAAEVVQAYYESINRLDHLTMEDAVVDNAGRDMIRTVTKLYVMSRMRLAVEMTTGFVDAETWIASGGGPLPDGHAVYGVAALETVPLFQDESRAEYRVRYEMWIPVGDIESSGPDTGIPVERTDDDNASAAPRFASRGVIREERVRLRRERGDWFIYSIGTVSETVITRETSRGSAR